MTMTIMIYLLMRRSSHGSALQRGSTYGLIVGGAKNATTIQASQKVNWPGYIINLDWLLLLPKTMALFVYLMGMSTTTSTQRRYSCL